MTWFDPYDPLLEEERDAVTQQYGGYMGQMDDEVFAREVWQNADLETRRRLRDKYQY